MKKLFILFILLAVTLTGCSREGTKSVGARRSATDTVSAVLTNADYPDGATLNWASREPKASATLSGLQSITFILSGDEMISPVIGADRPLKSIELTFTGETTGKSVSLSNGGLGKVANLWEGDSAYFKVEGNSFKFFPHYFEVGEKVVVKATFTYKKEGALNQVLDSKTVTGFFSFTVGADTGESFSGGVSSFLDDVVDSITDNETDSSNTGDNTGNNTSSETGNNTSSETNSNTSSDTLAVRYLVNNATANAEGTVFSTAMEAEKHPIKVQGTMLELALFTQELTDHNITKVYVVPVGKEGELQKLAWQNDYKADAAHMFRLDMSAYPVVTLHIEFLDGEEWNPMKKHFYGFLTFEMTP